MGYRSGAPSWVHKKNAALMSSPYQSSITRLNNKIEQLEIENLELRQRIKKLEDEISSLKE